MSLQFKCYFKIVPDEYIEKMFEILANNMRAISPTGNSFAADKALWLEQAVPQFQHIILILEDDILVGYFQYRLIDDLLMMDEIQFSREHQGSSLFADLYRYITTVVPKDIQFVAACANKENTKSQKVLEHLGLTKVGSNKNGKSYIYRGMYRSILEKYAVSEYERF